MLISHRRIICSIVENGFHSPGPAGRFNSFLELGSYPGNSVCDHIQHMSNVVAVDMRPNTKLPKHVKFFQGTTDEFFKQNTDTFDAIFIDADHSADQVVIDFYNSLNVLRVGGIIFLHDTDPITKDFTKPTLCNDSYKAIEQIRSACNNQNFNIINLPITSEGLCIVQRKYETRVDRWSR